MIKNHEEDTAFEKRWVKSETSWLKKLIYTGLLVCACWLVAIITVVIYNLDQSYIFYPMWIGISILVYWIGYEGLNKSAQLKERIELRKMRVKDSSFSEKILESGNQSDTFTKIDKYVKENKSYLNPNLNLGSLSKDLDFSEGYMSQLINANSSYNFNDYINLMRVEEAKIMLVEKSFDNYTIISIGLESGFNSKSSFYTAFKKFTGQTPSEYKKCVRNL